MGNVSSPVHSGQMSASQKSSSQLALIGTLVDSLSRKARDWIGVEAASQAPLAWDAGLPSLKPCLVLHIFQRYTGRSWHSLFPYKFYEHAHFSGGDGSVQRVRHISGTLRPSHRCWLTEEPVVLGLEWKKTEWDESKSWRKGEATHDPYRAPVSPKSFLILVCFRCDCDSLDF